MLARVATSMGHGEKAVQGYQAALAASPGNRTIAEGAFAQALSAGDRPLAVTSARILEESGGVSFQVRLVLIAEAVRGSDWAGAEKQIAALNRDDVFSFMSPIMRAWIAVGSKADDPLAQLSRLSANTIGGVYAQEHKPLLMLALGQDKEGLAELRNRIVERDTRGERLKLAGAAYLARKGKRKDAIALLDSSFGMVANARTWLEQKRKLRTEIATPAQGMAELFLRLSLDLERQNDPKLALSFARLATFLAPEQSEAWLVTSALLTEINQERDALTALGNIPVDDPADVVASDLRVRLLAQTGEEDVALDHARKATSARDARSGDWERLGDLYSQLGRNQDAAGAYGQALQVNTSRGSTAEADWRLWLSKGGALDQAGQWPEAKAALETAYKLAPREPTVLNYLGYAQLTRRENLVEAENLIRQARRFNPESAQITDSLGWARFLRGDSVEAIRLLERAVMSEPNDATINEHLGDAYYSVGRRFEARYAWRAALVTAADKDAGRLRAKIDQGFTAELASP